MEPLPNSFQDRKKDAYGIWIPIIPTGSSSAVKSDDDGFWDAGATSTTRPTAAESGGGDVASNPLAIISDEVRDEIEALQAIYNEDRDVILTEWPPKVIVTNWSDHYYNI